MYTLFINCESFTKGWSALLFKENKIDGATKKFYIYPSTTDTINNIIKQEKVSNVILYGSKEKTNKIKEEIQNKNPQIPVMMED